MSVTTLATFRRTAFQAVLEPGTLDKRALHFTATRASCEAPRRARFSGRRMRHGVASHATSHLAITRLWPRRWPMRRDIRKSRLASHATRVATLVGHLVDG